MRLLPLEGTHLSLLGKYVTYPIGKILCRCMTMGYYPPEGKPHNELMIALTPWWFFCIVAVAIWS